MAYKYDYICDPDGVTSKTGWHSGMSKTRLGIARHNWVAELFNMGLDFWTIQLWTGLSDEYLEAIGRWHGIPLRYERDYKDNRGRRSHVISGLPPGD